MKGVIVMLLLASSFAHADELESMDLLNHRLSISVPKGARNEARGHSIMAAPEANESETRLVFEDGEKKLVVMAWELFQRSAANYQEEVYKTLKEWSEGESTPFKISTVREHITLGIPEKPNTADDAILYAAAFVRHEDSAIQRVGIYFNPEFHKTPERCAELAGKIIESINAGSRSLDLKAGERRLGVLNEGVHMTVVVPDGWTYTTQRGPDFLVHNLEGVSDFGSPSKSIGVYVGGHPGYHHEEIAEGSLIKGVRKAPLFGQEQEWVVYSDKDSKDWKSVEIIRAIPQVDEHWKTHLFMGGTDDKQLDELLKIVATARIEKAEPSAAGKPATRSE